MCQQRALRLVARGVRPDEGALPPDYDECVDRAFNLMSEPGMTRFGTACSGTDQVSRVLHEYGVKTGGKFLQVWACEKVQWKRDFIEKNAIAPMPIFTDLTTLASSCITGAVDSISQAPHSCVLVRRLDCLLQLHDLVAPQPA